MSRRLADELTEICSLRSGIENAAWEEARGKLLAYLRLRGSLARWDKEEYNALENLIKGFIRRMDDYDIYPDEASNE